MPEDGMIVDDTASGWDDVADDTGMTDADASMAAGGDEMFDDSQMSDGTILDDELVPLE